VWPSVAGLFFLRFAIPPLVAPEGYGFSQPNLRGGVHRTLVLVSKFIQNASTGVEFGGKEPYMTPLNAAVARLNARVRDFLRAVCDVEAQVRGGGGINKELKNHTIVPP
jgi:hypothetical protein